MAMTATATATAAAAHQCPRAGCMLRPDMLCVRMRRRVQIRSCKSLDAAYSTRCNFGTICATDPWIWYSSEYCRAVQQYSIFFTFAGHVGGKVIQGERVMLAPPRIAVAALMILCGGCAEAWHARSLATFSMRAPTEGEPGGIVRVVYRCCSRVQACECQCVGPLRVPCSRLPGPGRHSDDLPAEDSWSTRGAGGSARYVAAVFPCCDTLAGKQPRLRMQRKRRGRAPRQSARGVRPGPY